jgi:hypothetical protein
MSVSLEAPTAPTVRRVPGAFLPREGSLFSPAADILMAGGISLVVLLALRIGLPHASPTQTNSWAWAVYYVSFFVNYPHFAASYQLIYSDARPGFRDVRGTGGTGGNRKFALKLWWAGVVVPLLLIAFFMVSLAVGSATAMGWLVNVMFLTVGWHYVKQIFGCFVVLSSVRRVYYSALERRSVLAALYALWFASWVAANQSSGRQDYYGIGYTTAALPHWTVLVTRTLLVGTAVVAVAVISLKALRQGKRPPASALVAVVSVYAWLMPGTTTPMYVLIVPAFHSLQYLLFVLAYKRNHVVATNGLDVEDLHPVDQPPSVDRARSRRSTLTVIAYAAFLVLPAAVLVYTYAKGVVGALDVTLRSTFVPFSAVSGTTWVATGVAVVLLLAFLVGANAFVARSAYASFAAFFVGAVVLGAVMFGLAPTALDVLNANHALPAGLSYDSAVFGTTLYLFFFTVFVNIHHYFIDNVIWKRDNPFVRRHLVS